MDAEDAGGYSANIFDILDNEDEADEDLSSSASELKMVLTQAKSWQRVTGMSYFNYNSVIQTSFNDLQSFLH
jgi:hypothetical protein